MFITFDHVDTQSIQFVDQDQFFRLRDLGPGPADAQWEVAELAWGLTATDEHGRPLRRGSVSSILSTFVALPSDHRPQLEPIVGRDGEFLPATLKGKDAWIYRTSLYLDAVDRSQSHLTSDTRLRRGDRMVVKRDAIGDARVFCLSAMPFLGMFFSEDARKELVATGLFDTIEFRSLRAIETVDQ